jgi:hypothetical protein
MNQPPTPADDDDEALAAALGASRVLQDAPEALVLRAIGLWQQPAAVPVAAAPSAAASALGGLRRLVATLVFDSLDHGALAGGRRSAATMGHLAARQLLYSTDGRDIDLRLTPLDGGTRWVLSGQVLGPELSGQAELRPSPTADTAEAPPSQVVAWNELAEFEFAPMEAGPCSLVLSAADWTVELGLFVRAAP